MKDILGIDHETAHTTAVIVDDNASFADNTSHPIPARSPLLGGAEHDPCDLDHTVKEAVAPLIDQYDISAIGLDHQGQSFIV